MKAELRKRDEIINQLHKPLSNTHSEQVDLQQEASFYKEEMHKLSKQLEQAQQKPQFDHSIH